MRIITKEPLQAYIQKHPDCKTAIQEWVIKVEEAQWENSADIKASFSSVDMLGNQHYVFNIRGNNHRLIVVIKFFNKSVLIRFIGTHDEYMKIKDVTKI